MCSITKTKLSYEEINHVTVATFGHESKIMSIKELKGGFFNVAYLITFENNMKTV
ncbi:hypothetical protein ACFFF5_07995 [Lederbergia wuyishanensis]|uniref:Uncharacterized protein n=1 Tax=Lederbergia wuyishanensis TaxID=1347903 RepID=A0ABU0D6J9_9BACI|nr:hypothetical protein [Lederbergia wuyishanensis]MCJ8008544.1 hypothetical protein [Lederbergia wuyishanensis]MDQ0344042.1 hypothetical protein [Lederbergia wuyishanensis]